MNGYYRVLAEVVAVPVCDFLLVLLCFLDLLVVSVSVLVAVVAVSVLPDGLALSEALDGRVTIAPFWVLLVLSVVVVPVVPVVVVPVVVLPEVLPAVPVPVVVVPVVPVLVPVVVLPVVPLAVPVVVPVVLPVFVPVKVLSVVEAVRLEGVITLAPFLAAGLLLLVAAKAGRVKAALKAVTVTRRRVSEFNANIEDS